MPNRVGAFDGSIGFAPTWGTQTISEVQSKKVVSWGRAIAAEFGTQYAKTSAPRSPNPYLSGNFEPAYTNLSWLAGQNKCNQFVGDVLYLSGVRVPLSPMAAGGYHYLNAEGFLRNRDLFAPVTDLYSVRPGDILALDYTKAGANGAHLEIVTGIDPTARRLVTVGAHRDGASEVSWSVLRGLPSEANREYWQLSGKRLYFLRPRIAG